MDFSPRSPSLTARPGYTQADMEGGWVERVRQYLLDVRFSTECARSIVQDNEAVLTTKPPAVRPGIWAVRGGSAQRPTIKSVEKGTVGFPEFTWRVGRPSMSRVRSMPSRWPDCGKGGRLGGTLKPARQIPPYRCDCCRGKGGNRYCCVLAGGSVWRGIRPGSVRSQLSHRSRWW
jgi:hypothetical protein